MKNLHFCPECKESVAFIGVHWDQWRTEFIKAHTGHKGYPSSTPSEKEEENAGKLKQPHFQGGVKMKEEVGK